MPDDIAISVIVDQLQKYHPLLTVEEVSTAIELNCAGKLPKKIECYNVISPNYLSDVIYQYQDHAKIATVLKVKQLIDKENDEKPKDVQTPQQAYLFIKNFKTQYKELPRFADWNKAFNFMYQNGMVIEQSELIAWMNNRKGKLVSAIESRMKTAANLRERNEISQELDESKLKLELRKLYVTEFI